LGEGNGRTTGFAFFGNLLSARSCGTGGCPRVKQFFIKDFVAKIYALITDVDPRPSN
jgi:hypothetical protein